MISLKKLSSKGKPFGNLNSRIIVETGFRFTTTETENRFRRSLPTSQEMENRFRLYNDGN
jgi:hypothetical protein